MDEAENIPLAHLSDIQLNRLKRRVDELLVEKSRPPARAPSLEEGLRQSGIGEKNKKSWEEIPDVKLNEDQGVADGE